MNNYKVVEKFISINGEGSRAGQLAAFIRFHYCNLNCSYCDTRYANDSNSNYELLSAQNILDYLKANKVVNVTLTGGEPLLQQNIDYLIDEIFKGLEKIKELRLMVVLILNPLLKKLDQSLL